MTEPSPPSALFLLWCLDCTPEPSADNPLPFASAAERGRWASAHTKGAGHGRWRVLDLPDALPPSRAEKLDQRVRETFDEDCLPPSGNAPTPESAS